MNTQEQAVVLARNFIYDNKLYGYKFSIEPDSVGVSGTNAHGYHSASFEYAEESNAKKRK